jgi:hypothetical protein
LDELDRRRRLLDERLHAEGVVDERSRGCPERLVDERPRPGSVVDEPRRSGATLVAVR